MPNIVPAAAFGLPRLSRRSVVSALAASPLAAVPVLALPALPAVAPAVASEAFAKLTAANCALQEISDRLEMLWRMHDRTGLAARRLIGPPIKPDFAVETHAEYVRAKYYQSQWKERFAARRMRIYAEQGHLQAIAEIKEAEAQRSALESELLEMPATDIPSLIVKARIAQRHMNATHSVIADMLAIFGSAA